MNSQDFCFWLQGMFELTNTTTLSEQQVEIIRNHLDLVFTKVTPDVELTDIEDENPLDKLRKLMEEKKDSSPFEIDPYIEPRPYVMPPDYTLLPRVTCADEKTLFC